MARVRLLLLCVCVPFFDILHYIQWASVCVCTVHVCFMYVFVVYVVVAVHRHASCIHASARRVSTYGLPTYMSHIETCVCVNSKSSHHKTSGSFNVSFCFSYFCFSTYSYLSLPFWAKSRLCSAKWLCMYWYYYALWQPHTYSHILGSHVVGELSRAVALSSTPVTAPYRFAVGQFSPLFFT